MAPQLDLFTRFGGIRRMAASIGDAPSSVQGWKRRRHVPTNKQAKVLDIGIRLGLGVTAEDVMFPFPEDRPVDHSPAYRPDLGDMEQAR